MDKNEQERSYQNCRHLLPIFCFFYCIFFRDKFSLGIYLILIICIFTDLGGYILGKIFKGPKLTKISQKKHIQDL